MNINHSSGKGLLRIALAFSIMGGVTSVNAAQGVITFDNSTSSSFNQDGFNVSGFWVENGSNIGGHLHVSNGVENHHFQGNNARQGLIITALDGSAFSLCSVDVKGLNSSANSHDLEIGTTFPPLSPGDTLPGYVNYPAPVGVFTTVPISGFNNITTLYITSQSSQQWDNVVLNCSITVDIDIKPGSDPNCFNLNGHGVIPTAILGSADFDVTSVGINTLSLAGLDVRMRGNKGPQCNIEDVNADGYPDLVCQFEDDPQNWNSGSDTATLTGTTIDGTPIEGNDSICIVP
ncbi:MAG: hypothetical protein GYB40_04055 [Vibrionaceae bacterium]|nr:hypothetical protein [Vibrionaceae bacterium]